MTLRSLLKIVPLAQKINETDEKLTGTFLFEVNMKINIFGMSVKIIIGEINEALGWDGFFDSESNTIAINNSLKGQEFQKVLTHEVIHACIDRLGWRQWLGKEQEEMVCEQLAIAFSENFMMKLKAQSSGGAKRGKRKKESR